MAQYRPNTKSWSKSQSASNLPRRHQQGMAAVRVGGAPTRLWGSNRFLGHGRSAGELGGFLF